MFSKLVTGQRVAVILAAIVVLGSVGFLLLPYGRGCTTTITNLRGTNGYAPPCTKSARSRLQYTAVSGVVGLGIAGAMFFIFAPKRREDATEIPPPPAAV